MTMTKEQQELLLKDLCGRLPYGVKCDVGDNILYTLDRIQIDYAGGHLLCFCEQKNGLNMEVYLSEAKPYLVSMINVPEEQIYDFYCQFVTNDIYFDDFVTDFWNTNSLHKVLTSIDDCERVVDWFNERHIDYRGLIHKKLALELNIV